MSHSITVCAAFGSSLTPGGFCLLPAARVLLLLAHPWLSTLHASESLPSGASHNLEWVPRYPATSSATRDSQNKTRRGSDLQINLFIPLRHYVRPFGGGAPQAAAIQFELTFE